MKQARQALPRSHAAQPKIAAIVRLLKRKRGVTAAEAAKVLGCADASVRAIVSRLEQQGAEIARRKERCRGGTVYTLIERFLAARTARGSPRPKRPSSRHAMRRLIVEASLFKERATSGIRAT